MGPRLDRRPSRSGCSTIQATRRTGCRTSSNALPKQVITVVPAGAGVGVMKEQYGRSLQILLGVCGLVLLIACANVANLLLARAVARRGADRRAGWRWAPSRRQIVTQALVESVLLAVAGGIAGLRRRRRHGAPAARARASLARRFLPIDTRPAPMVLAVRVRPGRWSRVSSLAPRRRGSPRAPIRSTRCAAQGRSTGDRSPLARTDAASIVQATVSVVLVAGSTMLARSLGKLEQPGLRLRNRERGSWWR